MQALKLQAAFGWRWVVAGWRLFRRQPFGFAALLFFYWLLLVTASTVMGGVAQGLAAVLPFASVDSLRAAGILLVTVLVPVLTVGFLQACRIADSGLPINPLMLLAPFRAGRQTLLRLFGLGAIQVLALVVILLATGGLDERAPQGDPPPAVVRPPATAAGDAANSPATATGDAGSTPGMPSEAEQEEMRREAIDRLEKSLAYLPIALVMWYAPILVAWHGLPPGKALFFSVVGVWRNRGAFAVYGLAWLAIWLMLSIVVAIVTTVIGIGNVAAFLAAPLVLLLLTCLYCSVYPTYATVFVDPEVTAIEPAAAIDP